jgi:hypothetical protein
MDQATDSASAQQEPTRSPKAHLSRHRGVSHWSIRWAQAKELLADDNGTAELLTDLQMSKHGRGSDQFAPSWREGLAVAIWMYLQLPDKLTAAEQFRRQYRPKRREQENKAVCVEQPVTVPTTTACPELAKLIEAWPNLPDGIRSYITSLVKPSSR